MAGETTPARRAPRRSVTITEVARHAGVAPSTVSYALSGKRTVSEAVRRRIAATIDELGYEPHAGARALASRRSKIVALMMPLRSGMFLPVLMEFTSAIVTEARNFDHDVLLLTREAGDDGLRRVANGSLADATILMDVEQDDPRIPTLRGLDRPAVLVGLPDDRDGLVCTDLDWDRAGRMAVRHLAELGHRRIGLLGQPAVVYERHTGFAERFGKGVHDEAAAAGARVAGQPCDATFVDVRRALDALVEELPEPTGLVVQNEAVIPLLLEELDARGIDVPGQLSIVSVAPESMASASPLTCVAIPVDAIGRSAVQLVMRQLDGETVDAVTLLPPELVQRGSTGSAPG